MPDQFAHLTVSDWRQFDEVSVDFHPVLTVLTGANGAGKTTLLNLLGRHFGWNLAFIATSRVTRKGIYRYYSGARGWADDEPRDRTIGQITYTSGEVAAIHVPTEVSESFDVHVPNQQPVDGVFLPSHRAVYSYQRVTSIPTQVDAREQIFEQYFANLRSMYQPQARWDSPSFRLKGALISLATFGYGNEVVESNPEARFAFEGFERILEKVLPPNLGFRRLAIRMPEIVLECSSGDFSLDAASGGVSAVIDIAWQLYMKSLISPTFVAVCDEPENHLHPEMQRSLLPGLVAAFPGVQFVIATHNPFVVTSVEDSTVVVLDYGEDGVVSSRLDDADRSASANQVLTDVLGVPVPIPLWVEARLKQIVDQFAATTISDETLRSLREQMNELGIGELFPEAVSDIVRRSDE